MKETMNDYFELQRLRDENRSLKESLKFAEEKYSIAQSLLSSNFQWKKDENVNDGIIYIREELSKLRQEMADICKEVARVMEENRSLKERSRELDRLESAVKDYEEKIFILTRGENWEKVTAQKALKGYRISAQILCYAIEGCTIKKITRKLSEGGGIHVTARCVNCVISVTEDKDLPRILAVFHQFSDVFIEHGINEEDVLKWFSEARIRELKLISRSEVEDRFGRELLESMKPDPYIEGEFYDIRGMSRKS